MRRFSICMMISGAFFVAGVSCKNDSIKGAALQSTLKDQVHQLDSANYTEIQWTDSVQNFGKVDRGQKVELIFHFKNTGNKPLFIAEVRPSCGCTVADYTKGAVAPGQIGKVTGEFDSDHGFPGNVRKTISVTSNTKNSPHSVLVFTGEVIDNKKQ